MHKCRIELKRYAKNGEKYVGYGEVADVEVDDVVHGLGGGDDPHHQAVALQGHQGDEAVQKYQAQN